MKTECMIKSVKSDLKDLCIVAGVVLVIGIIAWFIWSNLSYFTANTNPESCAILVALLVLDILVIHLSESPQWEGDPKNKPAPITWAVFLYLILMAVGWIGCYTSPIFTHNLNAIAITIGNTIIVVVCMIILRMYVRCKDVEQVKA